MQTGLERIAEKARKETKLVIWEKFQKIKESFPLRSPRLYIPFVRMQSLAVL